MQARHSAPEPQPVCGEEADAAATSYKEATLDHAPRAPFLSPVVPSKRAAPKEPQPVCGEELTAAAVALRQLDAIVHMPEPAKALTRQNSAHVIE